MAYAKDGQFDKALKDFDEAIRLEPRAPMPYKNRGAAYAEKGDHKRAIIDLTRAVALSPDLLEAYLLRAKEYKSMGENVKALADLELVIKADSTNAIAFANRGAVLYDLDRYENALVDFNRAIELDPNLAEVYLNRGEYYAEIGSRERAINDFTQALELNPRLRRAYLQRGENLAKERLFDRAIKDFDQAIAMEPTAQAFTDRGAIYDAQGDYRKSLDDYNRALKLNNRYAWAYFKRGTLNSKAEKYADALLDLQRAVAHNSGLFEARFNLALTHEFLGHTREAKRLFEEFIRFAPPRFNAAIETAKLKLAGTFAPRATAGEGGLFKHPRDHDFTFKFLGTPTVVEGRTAFVGHGQLVTESNFLITSGEIARMAKNTIGFGDQNFQISEKTKICDVDGRPARRTSFKPGDAVKITSAQYSTVVRSLRKGLAMVYMPDRDIVDNYKCN